MTNRRLMLVTVKVAWVALAAVGLLASMAGCAVLPKESPNEHTPADLAFAYQMLPHHRQAVRMADLVPGRNASAPVRQLAARIRAEQQPEIDQLTAMLRSWGVRLGPGGSLPGMNPGAQDRMPGMMSDAQLDALGTADGAQFDRQFLTMMIAHHQGAVDMANKEIREGHNVRAIALAKRIVGAQRAEIDQMRAMLAAG